MAGGRVLNSQATAVSLLELPTRKALSILKRIATSSAADPGLAASREDQGRLTFETGGPALMVNYSYVWPSAQQNVPKLAEQMAWARWPSVDKTHIWTPPQLQAKIAKNNVSNRDRDCSHIFGLLVKVLD